MARCLTSRCKTYLTTRSISKESKRRFAVFGTRSTGPQAFDNGVRFRLLAHLPTAARQWHNASGRRWMTTTAGHGSSQKPGEKQSAIAKEIVDNDTIARLAAEKLHELSLEDLVRHGRPPLSEFSLLASANFALSLIPIRLAHRLAALRSLPFIVVSNPQISKIYNYYTHSLATLLPYSNRTIKTLEEEAQFTDVMADLVQTHANTIPILARGFLECRKYVSPETVTKFLDEHLRARIGTRLIAEQHIALHCSSQPHCPPNAPKASSLAPSSHPAKQNQQQQQQLEDTHIGVIDTALAPANTIRHCESFVGEVCELRYGVRPSVQINGNLDARIAYVPTHLEYILTELLKNAFRATVENGKEREPVEVTIAASSRSASSSPSRSSSPFGSGQRETPGGGAITLRIRDRGGGIPPSVLPSVWAYSFTTFNEDEASSRSANIPFAASSPTSSASKSNPADRTFAALNMLSQTAGGGGGGVGGQSSLAGLGYGLPLGRAYAEHFGGGIEMESLWGWGTDVYLRVKGLDGF